MSQRPLKSESAAQAAAAHSRSRVSLRIVVRLLVLSSSNKTGVGHRILTIGPGRQRSGSVHRELVHAWREFVLAIEYLVEGDNLTGVGGHAAHGGHQAGFRAALHFVVRLVLTDGFGQVVPLGLVRAAL